MKADHLTKENLFDEINKAKIRMFLPRQDDNRKEIT